MRWIGNFAVIALISGCATAQISPAPQPCLNEEYRQFDFWLGTWDVEDAAGNAAGQNIITSEEGGCLIVERWTSVHGGTGQSYNFYDPGTKEWRQVWIGSGSVIDYSGGLTETGSMKLKGDIHYHAGGVFPFTGEWTLLEGGTVRQHFEQYDPVEEKWKPWFTGVYTKAENEE